MRHATMDGSFDQVQDVQGAEGTFVFTGIVEEIDRRQSLCQDIYVPDAEEPVSDPIAPFLRRERVAEEKVESGVVLIAPSWPAFRLMTVSMERFVQLESLVRQRGRRDLEHNLSRVVFPNSLLGARPSERCGGHSQCEALTTAWAIGPEHHGTHAPPACSQEFHVFGRLQTGGNPVQELH